MDYFNINNFMPHGMCYLWRPELVGMHVIADLAIALAYSSIPVTIGIFLGRTQQSIPHGKCKCIECRVIAIGSSIEGHQFERFRIEVTNPFTKYVRVGSRKRRPKSPESALRL